MGINRWGENLVLYLLLGENIPCREPNPCSASPALTTGLYLSENLSEEDN